MNHPKDPDTLRIPAYMRNKAIVTQARQKLILTALDRKEAGLAANSKRAVAPIKSAVSVAEKLNKKAGVNRLNRVSLPQNNGHAFTNSVSPLQLANTPVKLPTKLKEAGTITHYLEKIDVAIIKLTTPLKNGDQIYVQGENALFLQEVAEMQIDRKNVTKAKTGSHIGMKVMQKGVVNGKIYKV